MSIIGIQIDKKNPEFSIDNFTFWMPQFKKYSQTDEGQNYINKLIGISNKKIFYSIYGTDWELAMSYCIAHYLTLIAQQEQAPSGDTLAGIAGGGAIKGLLSSASVGNFTKQYDIDKTVVSDDEAKFWNQTSYGASLMALYKTKSIPSMFVITSYPVPGSN